MGLRSRCWTSRCWPRFSASRRESNAEYVRGWRYWGWHDGIGSRDLRPYGISCAVLRQPERVSGYGARGVDDRPPVVGSTCRRYGRAMGE
ncbi:hypothetical protein BS297_06840, partial [Rhodococcus erythropolis]